MEVYKRGESPYWQADIYVQGKRRRVSLKPLRHEGRGAVKAGAATLAAEKLQAELDRKAVEAPHARTLRETLDDYVTSLEEAGKASAKGLGSLRDKSLGLSEAFRGRHYLAGDMALSELTSRDLENLSRARRKEGNGAQTIAHELKLIRAAVYLAASLGYAVPAELTSRASRSGWRIPKVAKKTRYLSWEEFSKVYDYLSVDRKVSARTRAGGTCEYALTHRKAEQRQSAQDLLVALAMTGGRFSEVTALTWDRVDLTTGRVRLFGTKDAEERVVPMPDRFREVLTRRLASRTGDNHLIFPGKDGDQRSGSCRAILRAMTECGLNREDSVQRYGKATVHSLRHTFASWALQNGADLSEVQDTLGHASMQMTRRYAHLAKHTTATKLSGILDKIGRE